ncbi:MAG: hypothetical protein IPI67_26850 [Myxococcales bacterium]|nr:hypothetical protein [Myxococcales bacterium]
MEDKKNPPVLGLAGQLLVNLFASRSEDWSFTEGPLSGAQAVADAIRRSVESGEAVRLDEAVDRNVILRGFEIYVEGLKHEIGLISWTDLDNPNLYRHIAASSGATEAVPLPRAGLLGLQERAALDRPTAALVVHNHPPSEEREFFTEMLGFLPGPSAQDRDLSDKLRKYFRNLGSSVQLEALLFEGEFWRPIQWQSHAVLARVLSDLFQGPSDKR